MDRRMHPPARAEAASGTDGLRPIAVEAAHFAVIERDRAEAMIDAHATQAIRGWRLDEATYWQRLKFHACGLRSAAGSAVESATRSATRSALRSAIDSSGPA